MILLLGIVSNKIKFNNIIKFKVKKILFKFKKYNIKICINTILSIYDFRNETRINDIILVSTYFYHNILKKGIILKIIKYK